MIREIKDYGFKPEPFEKEAYVSPPLGSRIPIEVLSPDGKYKTPKYEPQARGYETSGCTVYGMQNQIEMYMMAKFGFEPNYAERFNYILAGITIAGADPQKAYESARKNDGLVDEEWLPRPDTYKEFSDEGAITPELIIRGQDWLDEWELKHEWLKKPTKEEIINHLKRCPVAVAVTAWWEDSDGYFIDSGSRNTHWCVAFEPTTHEPSGKPTVKVFDTYHKSVKTLHPNHFISVAKVIHLKKRTDPRKKNWFVDLWGELIKFIRDIIRI